MHLGAEVGRRELSGRLRFSSSSLETEVVPEVILARTLGERGDCRHGRVGILLSGGGRQGHSLHRFRSRDQYVPGQADRRLIRNQQAELPLLAVWRGASQHLVSGTVQVEV